MPAKPRGPQGVAIRKAVPADVPVLGRLGAHLVALHHVLDPQRFMAASPHTEQGYGAYLQSQLDEPQVIVLVAERDGVVLGYAYGGMEGTDYMALRGPAGALYDLVVEPDQRGNGIGRLLLEAALAGLKRLGAPRVVLSTAQRNAAAQRLFASAGFRPTMIEMTRELE
jgi:ribosomal protein S18 acetylase RimI-like enzyme